MSNKAGRRLSLAHIYVWIKGSNSWRTIVFAPPRPYMLPDIRFEGLAIYALQFELQTLDMIWWWGQSAYRIKGPQTKSVRPSNAQRRLRSMWRVYRSGWWCGLYKLNCRFNSSVCTKCADVSCMLLAAGLFDKRSALLCMKTKANNVSISK